MGVALGEGQEIFLGPGSYANIIRGYLPLGKMQCKETLSCERSKWIQMFKRENGHWPPKGKRTETLREPHP